MFCKIHVMYGKNQYSIVAKMAKIKLKEKEEHHGPLASFQCAKKKPKRAKKRKGKRKEKRRRRRRLFYTQVDFS